jgi:hypothetical protein
MASQPRRRGIAAAGEVVGGAPRKPYQQDGSTDQVVAEFDLPNGLARATISTFRGVLKAQVRLWVEPYGQPGAPLIPTKSGFSVPLEYMDDFEDAVSALASAAAEYRGKLYTSARRRSQRIIEATDQALEHVEQLRSGRRSPKQVEGEVVT